MSIPDSVHPLLLGAAGQETGDAGGYEIERSVRFNSADSAYLSRTPASAGNRKTWTWAGWVKRSGLGTIQTLFGVDSGTGNDYFALAIQSDNTLYAANYAAYFRQTSQVLRDPSAWYHIVLAVNTTAATAADRLKLYINGSQISVFQSSSDPAQNTDLGINAAVSHNIGRIPTPSRYFDGYLADIHFIDGQALTPSDFAETDSTTGQWVPKAYTGTYGTNGFHLPFSDNSTAAALGTDTSGNGNDWTVNNISVTATDRIYAGNASAAVGGVVPNGGTPYWVDILPTNADLAYSGGPGLDVVHDGNLATHVYWVGDDYTTGNVTRARFDLRDFPTVTSVRLYASQPFTGSPYTPYSARLLDSSKNAISGTSIDITNSSAQWLTVPVSGSPAFIEFYLISPNAERLNLYAIEVNGQVLVNQPAKDNDSLVDSPTSYGTDTGLGAEVRGNYVTLNPLDKGPNITLSNGNLAYSQGATTDNTVRATIGMSFGKWYCEVTVGSSNKSTLGIAKQTSNLGYYLGSDANGWSYYTSNGNKYNNGTGTSYGATFGSGDVIGIAFNADDGTLTFYKNGVSQGTAFTGLTSGPYFFSHGANNADGNFNFGQRPFAYTAPSGYKALCDTNLPAPVVAQPSTVMDVVLWTGDGTSSRSVDLPISSDLVWAKKRSSAASHQLADTVRGSNSVLLSNSTGAESNPVTGFVGGGISSISSTAFTISQGTSTNDNLNQNSATFVAWTWDAGSSTVTNTQGSITSQVRANASAGFSIVSGPGNTYFGGTLGHGLGVAPEFILSKDRDTANQWYVYHKSLTNPNNYNLVLNSTAAEANFGSNLWNVTSTTFGSDQGITGRRGVHYCFAPVAGYSSFGSYTGNGSADGPFVYTGFRPRWILIKRTNASGNNWVLHDTARDQYNASTKQLLPSTSNAETDTSLTGRDILSNGFKLRGANDAVNASGSTYVYAAFAESPFQYARAR